MFVAKVYEDLSPSIEQVEQKSIWSEKIKEDHLYFLNIADVDQQLVLNMMKIFGTSDVLTRYDFYAFYNNKSIDENIDYLTYGVTKESGDVMVNSRIMIFVKRDKFIIPIGLFKFYQVEGKSEMAFFISLKEKEQGKGLGTRIIKSFVEEAKKAKKDKTHRLHKDFVNVNNIFSLVSCDNISSNKCHEKIFKKIMSNVHGFGFTEANIYVYNLD